MIAASLGWIIYVVTSRSNLPLFQLPFAIGLALLFVYAILDARKGKLTLSDDYIIMDGVFGTRKLSTDNVKGFRKDKNYITIVPKGKIDKKIKVSAYYGDSWQIISWLSERYDDLDITEAQEEHEEILSNPEFGLTEEIRERRLEEAKKAAWYLNTASWGVLAWLFFYPHPYNIATSVAAAFPLLAILTCYAYRGFMKGDDTDKSAYPSVLNALIMPSIVLMLRAILDFNILAYEKGWLIMGFMAATLYIAYMLPTGGFAPKTASHYFMMFFLPVMTFAYSFGTYVVLNCQADTSTPAYYRTVIESKRISKGKSTTYYLTLNPWGEIKEPEEVTVTYSEYDYAQPGDTVTILQHPGYLKLPWIEVVLE